jgi:hypothetical protein
METAVHVRVADFSTITLYPIRGTFKGSIRPSFTVIKVTYEDAHEWRGYPVANPNCPELGYPKFAWSTTKD